MDELSQIIKSLRALGSGQEKPLTYHGICGNLAHLQRLPEAAMNYLLGEAFPDWPHYSGNPAFPVPDPKAPSDKAAACTIYFAHENLWEESPYGNLRRELCLHIADWLEANKSKVLPLLEEKFHD